MRKGGVLGKKFEIVPFDNKTQSAGKPGPGAEGDRFRHPLSSPKATARRSPARSSYFVTKYNERNPGKEVLYFNYAAVDPVLTNDKCNFWHFRWDANSDIKMEALTNYMKTRPTIKKVYLINQDYSFGKSVRTAGTRDARRRSARTSRSSATRSIRCSKSPTSRPTSPRSRHRAPTASITGNWGQDFALLLKAAADAGLKVELVHLLRRRDGRADRDQAGQPATISVFDDRRRLCEHRHTRRRRSSRRRSAPKYDVSLFYPRAFNEMRMLV